MLKRKTISILAFVSLTILLSGCFIILSVMQPATGMVGEKIQAYVEVQLVDTDENGKCGIVGIMLPNSWVVDLVYFEGDVGPDTCRFLPPNVPDCNPSKIDTFWADTLESYWPSGSDMEWRVYQSDKSWNKTDPNDWFADLYIDMTIGDQVGDFDLSYFVTNAGLEIQNYPDWYDISEGKSITVTGGTDVKDEGIVATTYNLKQNYPNPFNPSTTITFAVPEAGNVKLTVFNSLGEEVAILVDEFLPAGVKTVTFEATSIYSGVYYYRMETPNFIDTKKMVLLK